MLSFAGMYTMYIAKMGFNKEEISIAVTIYTVSGLIGQSVIGYLIDKFKNTRAILLICFGTGIFAVFGLPFAKIKWLTYAIITVWGFFISGTSSITDAWSINMLKKYKAERNFGRVRGFGSVGYGLSGAVIGILLSRFGWNVYYFYMGIGLILTMIVVYCMNDVEEVKIEKINSKVSIREASVQIFKIKPLIVMIIIVFMYNFVVKGIYNYLSVIVSEFGGGPLSLGFTYFFDATPEVVTFFLTSRLLKKHDSITLIIWAFVLQIIRLTVILIFNNALSVILMGVMSGFGFGLLASAYKTYIYKVSPEKYKTSCVTLAESIMGLSSIISAPVFGVLFTVLSPGATIFIGLIIDIISVIIILVYKKYFFNKPKDKAVSI